MKTTATNRKIRELLTDIRSGVLVPRPEFQRRLVWSNKHKNAFVETVLMDYPFPEIYVAAGEVDTSTGDGKEMLVDGQQRVTTLMQYFTAHTELRLDTNIVSYADLSEERKRNFLNYDVVVRDLGNINIDQIKEVFRRINSTRYALNAMEIHNARFEGEFKRFGDDVAADAFFEKHRVFSATDVKRMQDTRYALTITATIMSGYFNRDDDLEDFLKRYNDEFLQRDEMRGQLTTVFAFIDSCAFPDSSRAFAKTDLFNLIVEAHAALFRDAVKLDSHVVGYALEAFYEQVNKHGSGKDSADVAAYHFAAVQASNDKSSRITRGRIIRKLLRKTVDDPQLFGAS